MGAGAPACLVPQDNVLHLVSLPLFPNPLGLYFLPTLTSFLTSSDWLPPCMLCRQRGLRAPWIPGLPSLLIAMLFAFVSCTFTAQASRLHSPGMNLVPLSGAGAGLAIRQCEQWFSSEIYWQAPRQQLGAKPDEHMCRDMATMHMAADPLAEPSVAPRPSLARHPSRARRLQVLAYPPLGQALSAGCVSVSMRHQSFPPCRPATITSSSDSSRTGARLGCVLGRARATPGAPSSKLHDSGSALPVLMHGAM